MLAVVRDITERKRAEEALREAKDFRSLTENVFARSLLAGIGQHRAEVVILQGYKVAGAVSRVLQREVGNA